MNLSEFLVNSVSHSFPMGNIPCMSHHSEEEFIPMMNKKRNEMSQQMQDSQQADARFRDFVNDVSGQNRNGFRDMRMNKSRIIDEQNKMIDKQNLRK